MKAKELKNVVGAALVPHGFKKRGANWCVDSEDAIGVVNLQSSNYGTQYYVNLASWLKALGDDPNPKESRCHVRIRLTSAFPDCRDRLEGAFDLENQGLTDEAREAEIIDIVNEFIVPFTEKLIALDALREIYEAGELRKGLVNKKAQELLAGE